MDDFERLRITKEIISEFEKAAQSLNAIISLINELNGISILEKERPIESINRSQS